MPRNPTPQEIAETNKITQRACDSCNTTVQRDMHYRTFFDSLTITFTGGYGEFVDTVFEEPEFFLCHQCAHKLVEMLPRFNTKDWHPKTGDQFCNGWTIEEAQAKEQAFRTSKQIASSPLSL